MPGRSTREAKTSTARSRARSSCIPNAACFLIACPISGLFYMLRNRFYIGEVRYKHEIVVAKRRNPRVGCPRIAQEIAHAFGIDVNKDIVRNRLRQDLAEMTRGVTICGIEGGNWPAARRCVILCPVEYVSTA